MNKTYFIPTLLVAALLTACGSTNEPSSSGSSSNSSSSSSSSSSSTSSNGSSSSTSSGSSGSVSTGDLIISEVVAKSGLDFFLNGNDWVELQNTGSSDLNLNQYSIKDTDSELVALPDVILQPGEFFVIQASDEDAANGEAFLPFKLAKGDSVSLFSGDQQVDSLAWIDGDAKQGRSFGMLDGSIETLYPTPEAANVPYVLFSDSEVFTVKVSMEDSDWQTLLNEGQEENWYPADFEFNGAVMEGVAIRTKGQSSLSAVSRLSSSDKSYGRYGFKIDFNKYKDQKFMGMKLLAFNNGYADPTMMRDSVAYRLMKEVDMPAPELSYVDLWVGGKHLGVYQMIEPIDGEFVEKYFPGDKENDYKGDLYKAEIGNSLEWKQGDTLSDYDNLELKTNDDTVGTPEESLALMAFLESINSGSDEYIDTDTMLRYIAASILTSNLDGYFGSTTQNYYLYEHRSVQGFTMLPWDYNLAFGAINFGGGGGFGGGGSTNSCDSTEHLIDNPTTGPIEERPILARVLEQADLRVTYHEHLEKLLENIFNPQDMGAFLKKQRDLIDPYVKNDPTSFYSYDDWKVSLTEEVSSGSSFFGAAQGLMTFINARYENVRKQLDGDIPTSNSGFGACPD